MLDKRTSRSQNFKNFLQLQNHQQSSPKCDVFPQQRFDFTLADSSASTIYELLKSTYLYLDATQSPICSTLLAAIQHFEEFVAHSSYHFWTAVALSIQYQLAAPSPSKEPLSATSSLNNAVNFLADDDLLLLLESSAFQLESNCLALQRQLQLCESLHHLQANLATCEDHNLYLATISRTCKTDNLHLESLLSSCQDELSCLRAEHDTQFVAMHTQYCNLKAQITNEDPILRRIVEYSDMSISPYYSSTTGCPLHLADQLFKIRPHLQPPNH